VDQQVLRLDVTVCAWEGVIKRSESVGANADACRCVPVDSDRAGDSRQIPTEWMYESERRSWYMYSCGQNDKCVNEDQPSSNINEARRSAARTLIWIMGIVCLSLA
jgi:hypothetical protein